MQPSVESPTPKALADLVDSDPDMELVGAVKDAAEAIELALREHPDPERPHRVPGRRDG